MGKSKNYKDKTVNVEQLEEIKMKKKLICVSICASLVLFCSLKISAWRPSFPAMVFVEGRGSEANDFYMMKYNVTVKEYKLFLSQADIKLDFDENRNYEKSINECIEDESSAMTNLTLQEIIAFAEWLNKEHGLDSMYDIEADGTIRQKSAGNGYRLPSSEEWEWAKSGGKKSKGFEYPGSDNLPEVAWCAQNSKGKIHQPGLKKPNELGIYDMLGNVDEFCNDEFVMFPPNIDIKKIPCNEWIDAFFDFYNSVYNTFSSEPVKWQYVKKQDLYSMNIPLDESYVKKFTRFLKKSKSIDSMRLEDVYVDPDIESIFTELQYNGIRLVRTAEKIRGQAMVQDIERRNNHEHLKMLPWLLVH